MVNDIVLFFIFQLLNVISSTIKSIILIRCKNNFIVGLTNAINSAINFIAIKFTSVINLPIIICITICTNLIGSPLGRFIINLLSKDRLFIFNATIKISAKNIAELKDKLKTDYNIQSVYTEIVANKMYDFKIFSSSKSDSIIIENLLDLQDAKYHKIESR